MLSHYDSLGTSGLRFFGKVSASIAHEIKNVLAILNENAGLLDDLIFAAEKKGAAVDPVRLTRVAAQFSKQIVRADQIAKNLSRFAHSVDSFQARVDFRELAALVGDLAGRLAAMRRLTIVVEPPIEPVMIDANPFLLQNVIWLSLEWAFGGAEPGGILQLSLSQKNGRTVLHIGGIDGMSKDFADRKPEGLANLLAAVGGELVADPDQKVLALSLANQ